jgi:hypothetical protein
MAATESRGRRLVEKKKEEKQKPKRGLMKKERVKAR